MQPPRNPEPPRPCPVCQVAMQTSETAHQVVHQCAHCGVVIKLTTRDFGTCTRGFAAAEDAEVAVCVLPGTELAFSGPVTVTDFRFFVNWRVETLDHATAIFRQVNKTEPMKHHDALEFPDGRIVLLTRLSEGQEATVLQLPAQPTTVAEAVAQRRIAYVG